MPRPPGPHHRILHHLKIAGVKQNLFSDPAVTAI
ncbi:hypothetical protein DFAR_1340032 [Desulfarculales bacterium]